MNKFRALAAEYRLLHRSIPATVFSIFVLSVVAMNLLANKSIDTHCDWLALDCGIIFSWLTFLIMDIITKHFGARAATMASLSALGINLFMALMFLIAGHIPGFWGESFVEIGGEQINAALDNTISGTWYVLLGSSVAFAVSAVINNYLNEHIGRKLQTQKRFGAFAIRSYTSTVVGQFADNLTFALIVSRNFFGWNFLQCFTCAVTGALAELFCEVLFSPVGYAVSQRWEEENVGMAYLEWRKQPI